jgi:hypothetical protein
MNEKDLKQPQPSQEERYMYYKEDQDEISLSALLLSLWNRRSTIVIWSVAISILIVVGAGLIYLFQEKSEVARMEFKLEFDGVEKNQYPNGMKFSTSDILSGPVLNQVYKTNNLEKYIEFSDFKSALAIIQTNNQIKFLEYEYGAKLREKGLNVEGRKRLEAEFLEKKKNAMVPVYTIGFSGKKGLFSVPGEVIAKTLNDILRTWAEYADRVKGANKYRLSIVSRNILDKNALENEEYTVASDRLRITMERIKDDIEKLKEIPGASIMRTGKKGVSLTDLEFRIKDIAEFKLNPVTGLIMQSGTFKDKLIARGYLKNKLFELNLKNGEITAQKEVYDNSLERYALRGQQGIGIGGLDSSLKQIPKSGASGQFPTMIPQFGASFLNSLIELGQEQSDAQFRQEITRKVIDTGIRKVEVEYDEKFYQKQLERVNSPDINQSNSFQKKSIKRIQTIHDNIYSRLIQTIDELNALYLALSKHNLNPDSLLYTNGPVYTDVKGPLSAKKLLMSVIIAWILAEGVILFCVLIGNSLAKPREND